MRIVGIIKNLRNKKMKNKNALIRIMNFKYINKIYTKNKNI